MATVADMYDLALRYHQGGDLRQAESLYAQIIRADPPHNQGAQPHPGLARVHFNLGNVLHVQRRSDEAMACYRRAISLDPSHARSHNNLGIALTEQGRRDEAAASFRQAARAMPDYVDCHYNLGNCLMEQDSHTGRSPGKITERLEEAVLCFRRALTLEPKHVNACCNLGTTLRRLGMLDEALEQFGQVLCLDPTHPVAAWNRSLLHLQRGDFAQGWLDYERRLDQPNYRRRAFEQSLWDGARLDGKTILVYADGGYGDILQFIRYAPLIKERGGTVVCECSPDLMKLLSTASGIDRLLPRAAPLPHFDVQAPLMSLPRIFHASTGNIPANVPYLAADPKLVDHWRRELSSRHAPDAASPALTIGIAWQGNPNFAEDFYRSIPLHHFEALAAVPGVKLVSLQKDRGACQVGEPTNRLPILDLGDRLDSEGAFTDTAALMMNLDLIITSDTATAHLAGALGVPVWTLLPLVPEWRWQLQRSDSPWYPTMRLFRQTRLGDWSEVFERVAHDLRKSSRKR